MSERVPLGWILEKEVLPDGTIKKSYHNLATGQRVETKEEVACYENYRQNINPHLEAFCHAYFDEKKGIYAERPWEMGHVGKLRDEEPSRVTEAEEMPAKEKKENDKGKGKKK